MEKTIRMKARATLFPDPRLVRFGPNDESYFHSLFVGIVTPILQLPTLLWNCVLKHVIYGSFAVVTFVATCFWFGVTGRVVGLEPIEDTALCSIDDKEED